MGTNSIFDATDAPQSKDFIPAPGQIKTRFGNLDFVGGYPTDDTVRNVYDELDLQRATQLYLDMYPALSMHGMLTGVVRDYGVASCSDVCVTADRLDSKALFLTGNPDLDKGCPTSSGASSLFLNRHPSTARIIPAPSAGF